jgi:hypothetical protein
MTSWPLRTSWSIGVLARRPPPLPLVRARRPRRPRRPFEASDSTATLAPASPSALACATASRAPPRRPPRPSSSSPSSSPSSSASSASSSRRRRRRRRRLPGRMHAECPTGPSSAAPFGPSSSASSSRPSDASSAPSWSSVAAEASPSRPRPPRRRRRPEPRDPPPDSPVVAVAVVVVPVLHRVGERRADGIGAVVAGDPGAPLGDVAQLEVVTRVRREHVRRVQEAVGPAAERDERRADARLDVDDSSLVDVAQVRLATRDLDVQFLEHTVFHHRDPALFRIDGVDQHALQNEWPRVSGEVPARISSA